jgi:hypothetical protein
MYILRGGDLQELLGHVVARRLAVLLAMGVVSFHRL